MDPSANGDAINWDNLQYQSGFGNSFSSEAKPGALPEVQNNPQNCPYGLYAEQLSGTAFTMPRQKNQRTWLYRILPSVTHLPFEPLSPTNDFLISDFSSSEVSPNQTRWGAKPYPEDRRDFVQSLYTMCGAGSPGAKHGYAIHMYTATESMENCCLANADGDLCIVPQENSLRITTEVGLLKVSPGELVVIPRGLRFSVGLESDKARGYILEVFSSHFQLPDLGPIGANCLAQPRDFLTPVAWFEDRSVDGYQCLHKFQGKLFVALQNFSPFNVVSWHGNYVPYKYDLNRFCPVNTVSFDHPDPSIFTVLTSSSPIPGQAVADIVVFPPRWLVAENTFRPPYFHRNVMSEFMGLIYGQYEAKQGGFVPGGASLHMCMTPHGPDTATFEKSIADDTLQPQKITRESGLAFMFETDLVPKIPAHALNAEHRALDYYKCWEGLRSHYTEKS